MKNRNLGVGIVLFLLVTLSGGQAVGAGYDEMFLDDNGLVTPFEIATGSDDALWFTDGLGYVWKMTTAGAFTGYSTGTNNASSITAGPDGALWFLVQGNPGAVGRITTSGTMTQYSVPLSIGTADTITTGPDGSLWFTNTGYKSISLGKMTTAGIFSSYSVSSNGFLQGLTAGQDGSLWAADPGSAYIWRITTAGAVSGFFNVVNTPYYIVSGPDGALWFTESRDTDNNIGRITLGGTKSEYTVPTASSSPDHITAGPDNALWFTENAGNNIGRITTLGAISEYPIPTPNSEPIGITTGPDGALWFTEYSGYKIGRIDATTKAITEFDTPVFPAYGRGLTLSPDGYVWLAEAGADAMASSRYLQNLHSTYHFFAAGGAPLGVSFGSDGAMWITESGSNKIARATGSGIGYSLANEYDIPTASSSPYFITPGPDSNLWFTEYAGSKIGMITTAGAITEYPLASGRNPFDITSGPDNNLWFTESGGNRIGRITTGGAITEYNIPTSGSSPAGIAAGEDGNLWFTEYNGNKIGRITPSGAISEFLVPTASAAPLGITAGPDCGALWFTEYNTPKLGRIAKDGTITEYDLTGQAANSKGNYMIINGQDGALYFTNSPEDKPSYLAKYVPASYTINASASANGTITCNGGNPVYNLCDAVCTMTPNAGYHISGVSINAAGNPYWLALDPTHQYTFQDVTGGENIDITFDVNDIRGYYHGLQIKQYSAIQDALDDSSAITKEQVRIPVGAYVEGTGMYFSRPSAITMTLSGGWDTGFSSNAGGMSAIAGPLEVLGFGTLIVDGITID